MATFYLKREDGAVSALELIEKLGLCLTLSGKPDLPIVGGQMSDDTAPDRITILTVDDLEWHATADPATPPVSIYIG